MENSNNESSLKKFSGKNADYPHWKREFMGIMRIKRLEKLMNPEYQKTKIEKEIEPEEEKNQDLYAYTIRAVDRNTGDAIESGAKYGDGIGAWRIIRSLYESTDRVSRAALRKILLEVKLDENLDVEKYLTNIHQITRQLNNAEPGSVKEEKQIGYVLGGLPDSMIPWVLTKNTAKITLAELESELRANVKLLSSRKKESEENGAFFGRDKKKKSNNFKGKRAQKDSKNEDWKKDMTCYKCEQKGHIKRDCKNKRKIETSNNNNDAASSFFTEDKDEQRS